MKTCIITRRQFLKISMGAAAALGLTQIPFSDKLLAQDTKPGVVWIEAQDCAGCTESVISCLDPDLRDVILDMVSFRYHETIMAGSDNVAEEALNAAIKEGGYVLVVEGSFPASDERYLEVAGRPLEYTFIEAAGNSNAVVAVGACAAFGGIPKAGITNGQGVKYLLDKYDISKPLINLPGCPVHPVWFYDTLLEYLGGSIPLLDAHKRPLRHFNATVHDNCPRRQHYESEQYLLDWNEPSQRNFCLLLKGCKGQETYADCPLVKWNEGANWCIENNAPCAGCTEPKFYGEFSPLFAREESLKKEVKNGVASYR